MIEIKSPYKDEVTNFDNIESFPDLEFVAPKMGKSLWLHRKILADASKYVKVTLKNKPGQKLEWIFNMEREIDKKALIKALRFCYGETIAVGTEEGECFAMIATFLKLQVTCLDDVVRRLSTFIIQQANEDFVKGAQMLRMCVCYEECCDSNTCRLNQELAKVVLTKDNILNHYREIVDECLMVLPPEYLMMTEFGEPHTKYSEFCLRTKYVRYNKSMTKEDKRSFIGNCDWSTLNSQELRELQLVDIVDKNTLLVAYEKALECCENERDKMEKKNSERNCLQSYHFQEFFS